MNIIVVGCGRVGAELAYRLFTRGHKVAVIDHVISAFDNLPPDFLGRTIEGEALNQSVLRRAGIESADGLAAVTNIDTLNAIVAHVARTEFNIPNVVVRNFDPRFRTMHEAFNLQIVGSSSWGAQRIEELLYHAEMHTVFSAGNGEVEVYEFTIPPNWVGCSLGELFPVTDCSLAGLTRAGRATLPSLDTLLEENDIILVSATFNGIEALRKRLNNMEGS